MYLLGGVPKYLLGGVPNRGVPKIAGLTCINASFDKSGGSCVGILLYEILVFGSILRAPDFSSSHMHTYIPTYIHTCMHARIHAYIHKYIRTYIRTYLHACVHTCVHTCMHTYIRTYLYKYVYMPLPAVDRHGAHTAHPHVNKQNIAKQRFQNRRTKLFKHASQQTS